MKIQIISLFPDMFPITLEQSMLFKAKQKGIVEFKYVNLRDFGLGPRKQVDDTPYGGGDGMLLRIEPLVAAIEFSKQKLSKTNNQKPKTILMTPKGNKYNQSKARELAVRNQDLIFVCARYEGYDERVVESVDEQISIGDYILTGGELPAMVVIDSVVRLLPGVLGGENSAELESFSDGKTLEHPQYTRPENFRGQQVPKLLLSGNHAEITKWRAKNSPKAKP